jgi:hypothetical protein
MDTRNDQPNPDPNFRWRGVSTDIRNRPTPNELDLQRAAARQKGTETVSLESFANMAHEAREIVHAIGLPAASQGFVRRVLELEHQNKLLAERLERLEMDFAKQEVQI